MFMNADKFNIRWHGEMGNEYQNNISKRYSIARGRYGPLYAKMRLEKLSNHWNRLNAQWYERPENIEKKKQCEFSDELHSEIQQLMKWEANLGDILEELRDKGQISITNNAKQKLEIDAKKMIDTDFLEITQKWLPFTKKKKIKLFNYLKKATKNNTKSRFLEKDIHLEKIKNLFANQFSTNFLIRRIEFFGYYLK